MSILIKNGNLLIMDAGSICIKPGNVLIKGDQIISINEKIEEDSVDQLIDAQNMLIMPGLNIAHAHSWAQLFKGALNGGPLEIWILDNLAPPVGWSFTERELYLRTLFGAAEMIRYGVTTVWDDVVLTPNNQDSIFSAYRDIGMRATVTVAMHDKPLHKRTLFLNQALPPELITRLEGEKIKTVEEWRQINEEIYNRWHGFDDRLNFGVSFSWPQGCSDELMLMAAEFSQIHRIPLITHVLETKAQQVTGQVFYDKSIIRYLSDLGILSPRLSIAHGIWITDDDIRLLADNQVSVLHNPSSNLTLGSGLMPYRKLKQAGVNIALGVDEGYQSKWNPFEMMRMAALIHKISEPNFRNWPSAAEVMEDAIRGGARSELIYPEVGLLAPGHKADLILIELDPLKYSIHGDIVKQLVYCETGYSVHTSIINGQLVMQDRRLLTIDEGSLFAEISASMSEYWKNLEGKNNLELANLVKPYVEDIYYQASKIPTGLNRWITNETEWIDTQAHDHRPR
jgi:5-methylthioadenosine/S-adenosylhomocysteine deaminase